MMPTAGSAVAGVVLAAGSSTRMGRNKLLLDLGGQTVVRRTVRVVLDAGLDPVLAVLGHEAARVGAELAELRCTTVLNPDHALGVATSLHVGVSRVPAHVGAIVVVLADMPFVTPSMIEALVERHLGTGAPVVVSRYGDTEAPPTLFARALFAELLAVEGERSARQVAERHAPESAVVTWPQEALRDLDVAADYAHARARLADG